MARPETQPDAFAEFLLAGRKGHSFVYFVGATVYDDATGRRIPVAETAFKAHERGKINLVQRRVRNSDGLFEYIAQKR